MSRESITLMRKQNHHECHWVVRNASRKKIGIGCRTNDWNDGIPEAVSHLWVGMRMSIFAVHVYHLSL